MPEANQIFTKIDEVAYNTVRDGEIVKVKANAIRGDGRAVWIDGEKVVYPVEVGK